MFIPSINISNIFLFPYTGRENNNYSRKYNKCYWLIRIHDNIFDLHNFAIFRDGRNLFSSHDYNIIHRTTRDVIVIIFFFPKTFRIITRFSYCIRRTVRWYQWRYLHVVRVKNIFLLSVTNIRRTSKSVCVERFAGNATADSGLVWNSNEYNIIVPGICRRLGLTRPKNQTE